MGSTADNASCNRRVRNSCEDCLYTWDICLEDERDREEVEDERRGGFEVPWRLLFSDIMQVFKLLIPKYYERN